MGMPGHKTTDEQSRLFELAASWRTSAQLERLERRTRSEFETFQFAVLGDCEPGRFWISRLLFNRKGVFSRQLEAIQRQSVDFSVQLGDMVSRGLPENYLDFFTQLGAISMTHPYLTVIGNHDRLKPHGKSNSRLYRSIFGRNNYFFDRGGARFVAVDSSDGRISPAQLKWLDRVLETPLRKIVFTHMPPSLLEIWGSFAAAKKLGGFERGAREFADLMGKKEVDRVYMGHVHAFGVQDYKNVRYVLTGGGGSPLFPSGAEDRFYHYLTVSVGPSGISERVHILDGSSFAIPHGKVYLAAA